MSPFFQSPETSPYCHDCSSSTKSDLAATSASFFRSLGCISSGLRDFVYSGSSGGHKHLSTLTVGEDFLPHYLPCGPSTPCVWREIAREGWGKKLVDHCNLLSLLLICFCHFAHWGCGLHFFAFSFSSTSGWHAFWSTYNSLCILPSSGIGLSWL